MQHNEEEVLSPTMKRKPLLAVMGLLPEMKSGRMKTSVILIVFLLVGMVFLGFRYWTVHQLSDRCQRRIAFLERTIYKNSRDADGADIREKDFQRELKKRKDMLVQMNTAMNSELAKLSSKWQLERENLMQMVDSKNAVIKRNGEMFSHLKKDYETLQQHMVSFQVNQSQLLEKFTAQSVRVEMLIKLKDTCYAQMRNIGRHVSVQVRESPGELTPAKGRPEVGTPARESPAGAIQGRESPGELAPAKDPPVVGTPARESPERVQLKPPQPARQSAVIETTARESLKHWVPARENASKGVSSRESPAGATQAREGAMVETPALEHPKEGKPARESPLAASKVWHSWVNKRADQEAEAVPAPALVPSDSRVPALPPQLGKEQKEKSDTEVQKQKKVSSHASVMKDNEDILPLTKKNDKVSAGGSVNAPDSKILPVSQPKEKQNNKEMEEKEMEEEEVPDYLL